MPQIKSDAADRLAHELGLRLFIWEMSETEEQLKALLPPNFYDAKAAARFLSSRRRKEWLAVRVLLHTVAGVTSPVLYKDSGAPFLDASPLHLSISHTGRFAAVALAAAPCGIDVEQWGPQALRLTKKFLKVEEETLLAGGGSLSEEEMAVVLWSAKESAYKWADSPGVELLRDITLRTTPAANCFDVTVTARAGAPREARIHYLCLNDFALTICV